MPPLHNIKKPDSARVLVSMPNDFMALVDNAAETEHRTRSELIREALRQYMKDKGYN